MMEEPIPPDDSQAARGSEDLSRLSPMFTGAFLVLAGMFVIMLMAWIEHGTTPVDEWTDALVATQGPPLWEDDVYPAWFHRFHHTELPEDFPMLAALEDTRGGQDAIRGLGLDRHEIFAAVDIPPEAWEQLLDSGRPPEPGEPEVLAGELTRYDSFEFLGETWRVTGAIRPDVAPFVFAYLAPLESAPDPPEAGFTEGWIAPGGFQRLNTDEPRPETAGDADEEAAEHEEDEEQEPREFLQDSSRASTGVAAGVIAGLIVAALGGTILQVRLIQWLGGFQIPVIGAFLGEAARRPRLLWGMHIFHYALFFGPMLLAIMHPLANLRLMSAVQATFREGDLAYVGQAYISGNILHAAGATFAHNFLYATVLTAILPSLIIPFWGVLKNMLSFTLVGFVMAPLWHGSAAPYTYHSLTMILELQAYMIAAVAVCFLPMAFVQGLRNDRPGRGLGRGLNLIMGGTIVVGVQLAIAAFYEAFTLIQFGGVGS